MNSRWTKIVPFYYTLSTGKPPCCSMLVLSCIEFMVKHSPRAQVNQRLPGKSSESLRLLSESWETFVDEEGCPEAPELPFSAACKQLLRKQLVFASSHTSKQSNCLWNAWGHMGGAIAVSIECKGSFSITFWSTLKIRPVTVYIISIYMILFECKYVVI